MKGLSLGHMFFFLDKETCKSFCFKDRTQDVVECTHKELGGPLGFIHVFSCFSLYCITNLFRILKEEVSF